jgi:S-adenosylmethionine uptake transporter
MSPNTLGALLMIASMASFTVNDTLVKLTDGAVPLFQLIFLRGLLTTALILATAGRLGPIHLNIGMRDWGIIALRIIAEIGGTFFFLSALFNMPLGNVTAILQVIPLSVTLASALVLREAVGWRRTLAILIGFCGVLLIVKPGAAGFNIWSVYALIAVVCVTVRDLATRQLSRGVPSMTVTLVTAASITTAAGLASLGGSWVPVSVEIGLLIAGASVFILGGYFFSIQVMRVGDVSFVAPFRYTGLIWALVLGWFVFGDWPGWMTLTGAFIVVTTGIFTLYRERKVSAR